MRRRIGNFTLPPKKPFFPFLHQSETVPEPRPVAGPADVIANQLYQELEADIAVARKKIEEKPRH